MDATTMRFARPPAAAGLRRPEATLRPIIAKEGRRTVHLDGAVT